MLIKISIKVILSILLLLCLLHMPYGYFQFVRFAGMCGFAYLGLDEKTEMKYFWWASAVLINPLIKISLGRNLWNGIDVIWAIILLASIFYDYKKK